MRVIREVNLGGKSWEKILLVFLGELATSLFVGIVTFFFCQAAKYEVFHTMVLVSIASYMGGRALTVIEAIYKAWVQVRAQTQGVVSDGEQER